MTEKIITAETRGPEMLAMNNVPETSAFSASSAVNNARPLRPVRGLPGRIQPGDIR